MALAQRFPHSKPIEKEIMRRFLDSRILAGTVALDFRLPYELSPEQQRRAAEERAMIIALKQHRIDAVIDDGREVWIVEVDSKLSKRVIGTVIANSNMFRQKVGTLKPLQMAVVVQESDRELESVAKTMGIRVFIV